MAETSKIEWCDGTVNFWWGCTKVGPGCDNCYAEDYNNFRGNKLWGPGAPRRAIKGAVALIRKLNRDAGAFFEQHGRRRRVFMQSMSDTFDNEVDDDLRQLLFAEAEQASNLSIIFLTKRITNVEKFIPPHWTSWPRHIGLMVTTVNQREADRDIIRLLLLKAKLNIPWVGVSIEPMLEPINLRKLNAGKGVTLDALTGCHSIIHRNANRMADLPLPERLPSLDWVIVGGESGRDARPLHPGWVRKIQQDCSRTFGGTAFLFKQWGEWCAESQLTANARAGFSRSRPQKQELHADPNPFATIRFDTEMMFRIGKQASGRLVDGQSFLEFPKDLCI